MEIASENTVNHPPAGREAPPPLRVAPWEIIADPGRIFGHPREVLAAQHLSREEKRAILASWASDAWAVESAPALRHCPGLVGHHVSLDAVLDALRTLDKEAPDMSRQAVQPNGTAARRGRIRWLARRK